MIAENVEVEDEAVAGGENEGLRGNEGWAVCEGEIDSGCDRFVWEYVEEPRGGEASCLVNFLEESFFPPGLDASASSDNTDSSANREKLVLDASLLELTPSSSSIKLG